MYRIFIIRESGMYLALGLRYKKGTFIMMMASVDDPFSYLIPYYAPLV
jgi:hypothetical protein